MPKPKKPIEEKIFVTAVGLKGKHFEWIKHNPTFQLSRFTRDKLEEHINQLKKVKEIIV